MCAGVADDTASICKLAEAVYRGVLHALPASARAWFGDLRDRGLSAAVEVSQPLAEMHTLILIMLYRSTAFWQKPYLAKHLHPIAVSGLVNSLLIMLHA